MGSDTRLSNVASVYIWLVWLIRLWRWPITRGCRLLGWTDYCNSALVHNYSITVLHYCISAILQCMIIVGVLVYYFIVLEYCMDGLKQWQLQSSLKIVISTDCNSNCSSTVVIAVRISNETLQYCKILWRRARAGYALLRREHCVEYTEHTESTLGIYWEHCAEPPE